eukprot:NODE_649_length_5558_cov_0.180253.p1 type:complete len:894 gc:universal NODE_649_length_5558_cov_0.180253:5304-2623(-)
MESSSQRRSSVKTDDAISKMLKRQTFAESDDEDSYSRKRRLSRESKSINEFGKTNSTSKFLGKILDRKSKPTSDNASEMTADEVEEWNGTIEYNPAAVDVYLNGSTKPSCKCVFEVSTNHTVKMITAKQAIESILEQMEMKSENPTDYDLYHFDLKYHGQRVEFQHMEFVDEVLRESYLNSVDEKWRLIKKNHVETLVIHLANDEKEMILQYNHTLKIKDAIEKAKLHFKLPDKDPFNFFCTSLHGFWLEENKSVRSYEFNADDKVELRTCGYQLYIRVNIPCLDAKFVLKSPLSFTGADVFRLIHYNLKVRSLILPKPNNFYSMFLTHSSQWMDLKRCLSDYGFNEKNGDFSQSVNQCSIELRQQTEHIRVSHDYGESLFLLINEDATVHDVVNLCKLEITEADVPELWLYNKSGEKLVGTATIWSVLKEVLGSDEFVLREQSRIIPFQLSVDDVNQDIEIYPSRKIEELETLLERKFGISRVHFKSYEIRGDANNNRTIDKKLNFHQIKLKSNNYVRININEKYYGIFMNLTDENMWNSGVDTPDNIRYSLTTFEIQKDEIKQKDVNKLECNIAAGSLNKLIEKLTATDIKDFQLYNAYLQTFLLTYHSFTNSQTLFYKLKERYHVPRLQSQSLKEFIEFRNLVQLRVGNVLKVWTKQYQTAFQDILKGIYLIQDVLEFSETILVPDKQAQLAKHIRKCLLRIDTFNSNNYQFSEPAPLPKLPKKFVQNPSIFHHDPEEIARQLSLSDFKIFQKILPTEFLGQAWAKNDGEKRAQNVWLMTERFNSMASWTAKSVLEGKSVKRRSNRIEFLVELASCLLNLRNFSACMAVVAGLNSAAISRLKNSWNEVGIKAKKRKSELELALSPENAYRNYRSLLYANTDKDEARIPYM